MVVRDSFVSMWIWEWVFEKRAKFLNWSLSLGEDGATDRKSPLPRVVAASRQHLLCPISHAFLTGPPWPHLEETRSQRGTLATGIMTSSSALMGESSSGFSSDWKMGMNMCSLRQTIESTDETSTTIHRFNSYLGHGGYFRLWADSLRGKPRIEDQKRKYLVMFLPKLFLWT